MASRELNSSLIIPAAVPDGRDTDAWKKFWVLLFVMSVIQFSGAWIYPPNKFGGVETLITEKALGVPFQYCLWLFLLFGFGLHVYRAGFDYAARVFAPWAPFVVVALLASTFGISPFSSFRVLLLWVFCAMGAYVTAVELNSSSANKVMFRTLAALVVLSTFLAVVIPPMGTQSGGTIWRGIFSNKNQMGWIAALVLLVVAGMTTRVRWRVSAFIMLLAVVCLFKSGSKGALVACLVTLAYLSLVSALRSRVTPALGVTAVVLALFSLLMMGLFVLPALLALLGKDPTLTGRTFVWSMYFGSMVNTPFLGEGPGAYTYLSELTAPLAMRLVDLGAIVTPHNAFLGAFGDGGVFGLMAFAGVLIYLGVVAPFLRADRATLICAGVAFLNIAHGMVETHEVFTAGFGWFLMIFFRTLSLRQPEQQAGQEPGAQRPAAPVAGRAGR